jgi:hypothetical protein
VATWPKEDAVTIDATEQALIRAKRVLERATNDHQRRQAAARVAELEAQLALAGRR